MCVPTSFQEMKDSTWKMIFKLLKYLAGPEYMELLLVTYDLPNVLETVSKFLQEISRRLSLFALHNYLHKVVMPGVPDFNNYKEATRFWLDVCIDKLEKICPYIYDRNKPMPQSVMEEFNQFLIYIIGKFECFFQRTIWKEYL